MTRPLVTLREWKIRETGHDLHTPADRELAKALSRHRLLVDERRQGLRLSARSWVGVVRFHAFDVHIVP